MQRDRISSLACVLVIIVILFHILVFADVNVLFCKADTQNADAIKKVLRRLCLLSRHGVNYWKSSIFIDKLVPSSLQHSIVSILEIHNKGGQGTYISLPCPISLSKKEMFQFLKYRFWKKLNGWKEKVLSQADKMVLVKAIPTYIMSSFLLSLNVINLNSMIYQFFRGDNEGSKKLCWKACEDLLNQSVKEV